MEKPLRRPALNEAVRDYVKQYILEHSLSAGDPLPPETQLADELGVGRSSVREAIKALQSLGIVEARQGNGLYVREYNFDPILETIGYGINLDTKMLSELAQIRFMLEQAAIEEAVERLEPVALEQLEQLMTRWQDRVQSGQNYIDLDENFHRILYGALSNQMLLNFIEVFWDAFKTLDNPIIQEEKPPQKELDDHWIILEAVKARNAPLARQRLMEHFEHLQLRIRRAVDSPA